MVMHNDYYGYFCYADGLLSRCCDNASCYWVIIMEKIAPQYLQPICSPLRWVCNNSVLFPHWAWPFSLTAHLVTYWNFFASFDWHNRRPKRKIIHLYIPPQGHSTKIIDGTITQKCTLIKFWLVALLCYPHFMNLVCIFHVCIITSLHCLRKKT